MEHLWRSQKDVSGSKQPYCFIMKGLKRFKPMGKVWSGLRLHLLTLFVGFTKRFAVCFTFNHSYTLTQSFLSFICMPYVQLFFSKIPHCIAWGVAGDWNANFPAQGQTLPAEQQPAMNRHECFIELRKVILSGNLYLFLCCETSHLSHLSPWIFNLHKKYKNCCYL